MEGVQGTNLGQYEGILKPKCHSFKLQWPLPDWATRFITSILAIFGLFISISCLTREKDIWRAVSQSHNVPQADCESNPCCSPITCRSPSRSLWSWSPRSLPSWSWLETQLWSVCNSPCPDWRSTPSAASAPAVTTAGSALAAPCAGPIRRKYHHHNHHHHYQHQQKCCCLGQMLLPWLFSEIWSSKAFTFKQFLSHYAMLLNMQTQFVCLPLGLTNYLREGEVWQQFCPFHEICLQGNLGGGITYFGKYLSFVFFAFFLV